jgi:hypothetical protein
MSRMKIYFHDTRQAIFLLMIDYCTDCHFNREGNMYPSNIAWSDYVDTKYDSLILDCYMWIEAKSNGN